MPPRRVRSVLCLLEIAADSKTLLVFWEDFDRIDERIVHYWHEGEFHHAPGIGLHMFECFDDRLRGSFSENIKVLEKKNTIASHVEDTASGAAVWSIDRKSTRLNSSHLGIS